MDHTFSASAAEIEVFILTPDHGKQSLSVNPEFRIPEFKKLLEEVTSIPAQCQILYYKSTNISNARNTLRGLGILDGTEIELRNNNTIKISVITPKHGKQWLRVSHTMKIIELQTELEILTEIPIRLQALYHKRKKLSLSGNTLRELGILPNAHFILWDMQGSFRIFVVEPQSDPVPLSISPRITILRLQESLEEMTGIPVNSQLFIHKKVDLSLSEKTMRQLEIASDDRFELHDKRDFIEISIKTTYGRMEPMRVKHNLEIRDFQAQLERIKGIPIAHQIFYHDDINLYLSEKTFGQLNILPRAEFVLGSKYDVIIIQIRGENGCVGNYSLIQLQTIKSLILAYLRQQNPRPENTVTFVCRPTADGSPAKYENAIDVGTTFADLLMKNGDMLCVGTISKDEINPERE